jgi:uncharacterized lipoprotein YmbA
MRYTTFIAWILAALLLGGCVNVRQETRYYTLPLAGGEADREMPELVLGVGPLEIPELIDRREIVLRQSDSQVVLLLFDLWGGSAKEEIRNNLARNLSDRLGSDQIVFYPFRGKRVDYQLRIEILELIGTQGGSAQLDLLWSIAPEGRSSTLTRGRYQVPVEQGGVNGMVEAYSQLLGMLADDIAKRVYALSGK